MQKGFAVEFVVESSGSAPTFKMNGNESHLFESSEAPFLETVSTEKAIGCSLPAAYIS